MRLYVVNITHQQRELFFRPDANGERKPANKVVLLPGRQVQVGGDLPNTEAADFIINQIERLGGRSVAEKNRLPGFVVPYAMSLDRPVPAKLIHELHAHNKKQLTLKGEMTRRKAAIGVDAILSEHIDRLRETSTAVEAMEDVTGDRDTPTVDVGFTVKHGGGDGSKRGKGKKS